MDTEEDFPRSSQVTLTPLGEPQRRQGSAAQNDLVSALASVYKEKRSVKAGANVSRGQLPTIDNLGVGSLLLGSVAMVTTGGLRVHLPGGLSGFVRASDVFDLPVGAHQRVDSILAPSFSVGSHVIVAVMEAKNGFISLSMKPSVINKGLRIDSVTPGMLLPASVKSHEDHGIMLAFNFEDNNDMRGFLRYEDTASEVDVGSSQSDNVDGNGPAISTKVRGGKRSKITDSFRELPLHTTVYVTIDSVNIDRNMMLCRRPSNSDTPVSMDCSIPLLCVRPGLLLTGEITDVHYPASSLSGTAESRVNYGYDIKCLSELGAVVPALHSVVSYSQCRPASTQPTHLADSDIDDVKMHKRTKVKGREPPAEIAEKPSLGLEDDVVGRVIYVDHWQKTVYVSLLSHIVNWRGPKGHFHKILSNSRRTFAKVCRSIPGHGVIFSLCRLKTDDSLKEEPQMDTLKFDEEDIGFCYPSHMSDEGSGTPGSGRMPSATQLALTFTVGSVHQGVELEFDFFTRLMRLSMRKSLSKETLLSPFQLRGGVSVKGEITKVSTTGVTVRLSKLVHGKVALEHLTDVPLSQVPDRFYVGGTLKLRVLRFDHVHNVLLLTAKRVMRKDPSPLTAFGQLSVGKEFICYVSRVKRGDESHEGVDNGEVVAVRFYNDLRTTLDPSELNEAEKLSLDLRHGAVLRVVVTRLDPRRRSFYVTLSPEKMNTLKSLARAKQKRRRELRREACKKAFTNYVSSRKRRKAEA
ncbi:hypothetical protein X943_003508 [Babesia divergens]|uniref:S1 motif domain-containing protein n=1 Tax=Babesia divergens TaxID=32595 RepID=A0AAD9GAR1_BABDI|nr:hypothetical protein X943_003508 [Babesia divergens]